MTPELPSWPITLQALCFGHKPKATIAIIWHVWFYCTTTFDELGFNELRFKVELLGIFGDQSIGHVAFGLLW